MVKIYVDILIILNAFVNFFILLAVAAFSGEHPRMLRTVLASFVGALFSLAVFLDSYGFVFELALRLICSLTTVFVCFGIRKNIIRFLRLTGIFYGVSFTYAGLMVALKFIFDPEALSISNGVVYVAISPIVLIAATLVSYAAITVLRLITRRNGSGGEKVGALARLGDRSVSLTLLIDTGHDLRDALTGAPVIITDADKMRELLGDGDYALFSEERFDEAGGIAARFRMLPVKTVGGSSMLKAVRIDRIKIGKNDRMYTVDAPIVAESADKISGDYDAIAGTDIMQVTI